MTKKAHQAVWTGPDSSLRLAGKPARRISRGDEFEIPAGETVGGEGAKFDITGGPDFDQAAAEAKDLKVKGHTTLKTRKALADAVEAHKAEAAAAAEEKE